MPTLKELRELSMEELQAQLEEARAGHFNLRMRHATKELENTAQLPQQKKAVARILTVISEKQKAETAGQ